VLVQSTSYASDGTVLETTDPKGIKARTVLDDAGRKIKTIANYVDGTSGGGTNGDEDQVVTYTYTNGLMTAMTADLPGSEPDQTTTYAYGVEKGTSTGQSDLAGNRLLHAVTYPAGSYSAGADRQVTYAYNAQGQQRRMVDQAGNVTTTSYDLAGRETSRAVGVVTGFASDVQRIQTAYDARGMVSTVTQYDAQSGGTALDEVAYAYDDWGNLTNFDQDADSTFGGSTSGRWGVAYSWEKAGSSTTPTLLRRTCETLPGGAGLCYGYGSSGSIDAALSRVKTLTLGSTDVAEYEYRGLSQVAGTSLPEAGHESNQYLDSSPSSYGNIDAFGRVSASEWVKSSTGTLTYQTTISYDRNSNITQVLDGVHTLQGWSAQYSMDGLNRVIAADQGLLVESGGTYSVDADWRWRKELWTLNQTGNWSSHSVGDNSGGNNELAETGTFNTANEWTARSRTTPSTSPTSDTLAYDKVGNMTESGKGEKYVYDGFGRLREVHDWVETAPSTWGWRIHAAYRYNGLGMRLTHEINVDNDADIDGSDVKTYFAYDERWRVVGTYDSPTAAGPTERWVHHAAGLAGSGGSSYIDSVVLRDRDVVLSGTGSSYGGDALEERVYVLQNWRADVVATLGRTGTLIEWIQYTPYGMAVTNPPGNADFNGDGGVDGGDTEAFFLAWEGGLPSADINNDGGVDTADVAAFEDIWEAGETPQAGLCMLTAIRVGYAGYQWDGSVNHDRTVSGAMAGLYHVRYRVYDPEMGRWTTRDPIEFADSSSLYEYATSAPLTSVDPLGLYTMLQNCTGWADQQVARRIGVAASCQPALKAALVSCCMSANGIVNIDSNCVSSAISLAAQCSQRILAPPPSCNQDWLDCMTSCLETYDPMAYVPSYPLPGIALLPFAPWPKALMPGRIFIMPGGSPITTIPSVISKWLRLGPRSSLRGAGRLGIWVIVPYGLYMTGVEGSCAVACFGNPCRY
jgi:RHS repeat-associated protein